MKSVVTKSLASLKTVQILEGLSSFYADPIGLPYWPSVASRNTTLFLLKIYLLGIYINMEDLEENLQIHLDKILMIGAKVIIDT